MPGDQVAKAGRLRWLAIGLSGCVLAPALLNLIDSSGAITARSGLSDGTPIFFALMAMGTLGGRVPQAPRLALVAGALGILSSGLALVFRHAPHGDILAALQLAASLALIWVALRLQASWPSES